MAKRRGPALYELVRVRPRGGPFSEGQPQYTAKDEEAETSEGAWWKGSRIIRLPVGYVFLAIGLGIALMFGGYFVGYAVRNREIEAAATREAREDLAGISDPTLRNVPEAEGLLRGFEEGAPSEKPAREPRNPDGSLPNPYLIDDWTDDPRTSGMNYFIVATQPPDEANEAAAFLAGRGLEVVRLPVDNRGLAIVVVLEPFAPGEVGSIRARQLEARIKRLGREYRRDHGGGTDFESAYMKKYR